MLHTLTITRPDDFHLHLRDGTQMQAILPFSARQFGRAIIMPNLKPPVVTTELALAYRQRILAALTDEQKKTFEPLMTLYLTDNTSPEEITRAKDSGFIHGIKLYPAGATTHSDAGVTDITRCYATLEAMEKNNLPLLIHGEVTDPEIDIFDREKVFIDCILSPLIHQFPGLRIVLEHITTQDAVAFISAAPDNIAATITAHHLRYNRNEIFRGGVRPHYYCLPILKRENHRQALIRAATGGCKKFFLGTDSAPHTRLLKENNCGCAGIFTAHAAIELYAEVFDQAGALDKLEAFASFHGADFYQLPRNTSSITLQKTDWQVPGKIPFVSDTLIPLCADEQLHWKMAAKT
ncbi:dihydroorotase [Nitrosomonas marina]|uniref:Dihydroorotase n=1 Tax=Nitrosomonas marina TaxID=917 RepID=A0A1H8H281_9PROT|nr:dihydroorotase [Nitrosomonas marina]SEN49817.1 dihydroorotase [Nitrosomonas marina]